MNELNGSFLCRWRNLRQHYLGLVSWINIHTVFTYWSSAINSLYKAINNLHSCFMQRVLGSCFHSTRNIDYRMRQWNRFWISLQLEPSDWSNCFFAGNQTTTARATKKLCFIKCSSSICYSPDKRHLDRDYFWKTNTRYMLCMGQRIIYV